MSAAPATRAAAEPPELPARTRLLSAKALGVLAVVGLVVAFSLSSTLVKRAETPGVLVAFWRMITVSILWNAVLWSTGRRVTLRDVRQVLLPGIFFGLNLAVFFAGATRSARRWRRCCGSRRRRTPRDSGRRRSPARTRGARRAA